MINFTLPKTNQPKKKSKLLQALLSLTFDKADPLQGNGYVDLMSHPLTQQQQQPARTAVLSAQYNLALVFTHRGTAASWGIDTD